MLDRAVQLHQFVAAKVQHLQLDVELETIDCEELELVLLEVEVFQVFEQFEALDRWTEVQSLQPQCFELQ